MEIVIQQHAVNPVLRDQRAKEGGRVVNPVIGGSTRGEVMIPALHALLVKVQILSTLRVIHVVHINGPPQGHNPRLQPRVVPIALVDLTVRVEHVRHRHATHAQRASLRAREAPVCRV